MPSQRPGQSAVESSEERYRSLSHVLPVALVQLDRRELAGVFQALHAEGVSDLQQYFATHPNLYEYASHSIKVVEVNPRTVELFGAKDASQLLGPVARIWSESPETIKRSMQARFQGASRFEAEMKIRTFDGELRDVLYVAHFPEAFGHEALGLGCLVDISDRVKAETMLAEVQAEFAVIQEVLLFLSSELRRQGVETTLELAAALPDVVGDRVQLQQVFVNLAVNAIHAMAGQEIRQLVIRNYGDLARPPLVSR